MRPILKQLAEAIEQVTGVTLSQLKGLETKREISVPRLYFYYIANEMGVSYHEIGRVLNKCHTTVMNGKSNMAGLIETNEINAIEVNKIKQLMY